MSRIFMRPERDNNWYYESDTQGKISMKKEGVPSGPGGKLAAQMLQNKWDMESFYSRNGLVNPNKRWDEFRDEYLEFFSPPSHSENSFIKLKIVIKEFEALIKPSHMLSISDRNITDWRKGRLADGQGARSVDAEEGFLRPMLTYARLKGFMKEDLWASLQSLDYIIPEPRHLSIPEANAFLKAITNTIPHYQLLGLMAYECGMRVGELVHLRIEDVNFMKGIAHLLPHEKFCDCYQCKSNKKGRGWMGKAGVPRKIPLSPEVNARLLQLFQERQSGNIFQIKQDTVIRNFTRIFEDMKIEVKMPTHIFRHTLATHCDQAGVRPAVTSRILGHSRKSHRTQMNPTTAGYTHIDGEDELRSEYQKVLDWRAGRSAAQIAAIQ